MTAAQRKTPAPSNGGSDNGDVILEALNVEDIALWQCVATELISVGGTAIAITASSDTSLVVAITAYKRPMAFWLTPTANNSGPTQINIDTVGFVDIRDQDGNALSANALVNGRRQLISNDGSHFRLFGAASSSASSGSPAANGGRLTLSTGTPVMIAGVTGATILYWTPWNGNQIGLYDGVSAWTTLTQAEVSIPLTQSQTGTTHNGTKIIDGLTDTSQICVGMKISGTGAGVGALVQSVDSATQVTATVNSTASASVSITFKLPLSSVADVFGYNNSGSLKLEFCLWTSTTARATAITRQDGVIVKSGATTRRYLGTVATTTTDGQTEYSFGASASGGTAANLLLFNFSNRRTVRPSVTDSGSAYSYATGTMRSARASTSNRINFIVGISEDGVEATYNAFGFGAGAAPISCGVGLDSTSVASGSLGAIGGDPTDGGGGNLVAKYDGLPAIGFHFLQALEKGNGGSSSFNTPDNSASFSGVLHASFMM